MLMIAALYASAGSFVALLFQYINVLFPDQLGFYYQGILNTIRQSTAALIVIFPVYILTSWLLAKEFKLHPEKRELKLRKWLIYFTLFVASLIIIGDLVGLVYNFLSGELTARFLLKVLAVFVTAGSVFGYYIWDLKIRRFPASSLPKILAWTVSVVILAVIVAGFVVVGSPFYQRQVRIDEQRINDLQNIQGQIINYWMNKNKLPANLVDLTDSISGFIAPKDPETGADYEYNIIVGKFLSFELCAGFRTASLGMSDNNRAVPVPAKEFYRGDPNQQNWEHNKGQVCFERTIDPDLYPTRPKGGLLY